MGVVIIVGPTLQLWIERDDTTLNGIDDQNEYSAGVSEKSADWGD